MLVEKRNNVTPFCHMSNHFCKFNRSSLSRLLDSSKLEKFQSCCSFLSHILNIAAFFCVQIFFSPNRDLGYNQLSFLPEEVFMNPMVLKNL